MITTLQHISNTKCKNKHQDITNVQYKRNERSSKSSKLTSKSRENTRIINKRHHVNDFWMPADTILRKFTLHKNTPNEHEDASKSSK